MDRQGLRLVALLGCLLAGCVGEIAPQAVLPGDGWHELEPGLELGRFRASEPPGVGDGSIHVLRIDPRRFELRLLNASAADGVPRTAREWCLLGDLVAALNAGMYQEDFLTSVSLMRTREHTNNPRVTRHRSVLAFDADDGEVPPVKIIDLECDDFEAWRSSYGSFVQSIRMLSCDGENVWEPQARKSSTAAIGVDRTGNVLFVHVRSPFATHDVIDFLTDLPLELASLMYAEGGPEAQLFVRAAEVEYEFVGSYGSARGEGDNNRRAWPVPNVVAVARRSSATD